MNTTSIYIALLFAVGCNGQIKIKKDTITVNKIQMERPTITDAFEKLNLNDFKDNLVIKKENTEIDMNKWKEVDVLYYSKRDTTGTYRLEGIEGEGFEIGFNFEPKNSLYSVFKLYDGKTKYIKRKRVDFEFDNNTYNIAVGKEYFYNEQGKLTETINHDLGWDFSVERVVQFALDKGFKLPKLGEHSEIEIIREEKNKKKYWILVVEKNRLGIDGYDVYKLDAQTGEVLYHAEHEGSRVIHLMPFMKEPPKLPKPKIIVPDKTVKTKKITYTTYKGKSYTEEEWKAFEQEHHNEYLRKRGRENEIKPVETPKTGDNNSSPGKKGLTKTPD
jgi:hypothetical protein